jgi:hypothetical protein
VHPRLVPAWVALVGVVDVGVIADDRVVALFADADQIPQSLGAADLFVDLVHRRVAGIVSIVLPADEVGDLRQAIGDVVDGGDHLLGLLERASHAAGRKVAEDLVPDVGAVDGIDIGDLVFWSWLRSPRNTTRASSGGMVWFRTRYW